jgi:anti-sigma B factor antagonist
MSDPLLPVIVTMPAEIDITNADEIPELITAACAPGVTVIIADLTGTTFCDSGGLQRLIQASRKAAAAGAELRLAVSPGGAVSRVIVLTGIGQYLSVYSSAELAAGTTAQTPG